MHGLQNFIISFKIKIIEKPQTVLLPCNICVGCSSPKTDLVTNFLNLENRSYENIIFSQ